MWKYRTTHLHQVFFFLIGKTAKEKYQLLQQAYGEDAMGRTKVFDWFRRFKEGRTSVESDSHSGRTFLILRVSYTTSTLPTDKQLTRILPGGLATFAWISSPKTTGKMAGWRLDPAPRQCTRTHFTSCAAVFGQTWHRSVAAASILTRSQTVWLFPIPKA